MALWDIAGKACNVPCYQLLGGKYRDKVRLYADAPTTRLSMLKKLIEYARDP
jgi:L-alanine-DL-glutamate epimerase-like enolase superfamily enzyme